MAEIELPQTLLDDPSAVEVVRIWVSNHQLEMSLDSQAYEDPAAYGIILSDFAHHFAQICALNTSREKDDCYAELKSVICEKLGISR